MCGIAALFSLKPDKNIRSLIGKSLDLIAHRGPDGRGIILGYGSRLVSDQSDGFADWGLGHVRLAIIDTSATGSQPMCTAAGDCWISYNGEVYNYVELRLDLEDQGYQFRGTSDTEVILAAYRMWGPSCVKKFNGMFAFVIVDLAKGLVFAARDRMGVKPLYIWLGSDKVLLVSEPKQLLAFPDFRPKAHRQQVMDFLIDGVLGHEPNLCFFEGVYPLPPAHVLTWRLGSVPDLDKAECYWRPKTVTRPIAWAQAVEETGALFRDAVRLRLRSDVPVGSCMSGGADSSSIVGVATRELGYQMNTFSSCFDDERFDEQYYIDAVNRHCRTKPFKVFPTLEQFLTEIDTVAYHQDEPVGGVAYPQWTIMRAARKAGVPVLLDGQGGDEVLCGYNKFAYFYLRQLLTRRCYAGALSHCAKLMIHGDGRLLQWKLGYRYLPSWLRRRQDHILENLFRPEWQNLARKPWSEIMKGQVGIRPHQLEDIQTWSLPGLLRYEDRNSMAHSVETRLPFLDYRLVEHCLTLPEEYFLRGGRTKRFLVEAMGNTLPEEVVNRRTKMGFECPESVWMRSTLGEALEYRVGRSKRLAEIIDTRSAAALFLAYRNGGIPLSHGALYRLASLATWLDLFKVDV